MSNCPTSSFSILQESLLANVRRKLNWGWVSAGTGKIMIPGLCSNTGTFLLPLLQRNAVVSGLVRGCPSARSSAELSRALPFPVELPELPTKASNEHWGAGQGGHRLEVFVMWPWGSGCALGAAGDRGECWRESFQKSQQNCSVVQVLNCSLHKFLSVWWDGIGKVKHCVWEGFLSTASHGVS